MIYVYRPVTVSIRCLLPAGRGMEMQVPKNKTQSITWYTQTWLADIMLSKTGENLPLNLTIKRHNVAFQRVKDDAKGRCRILTAAEIAKGLWIFSTFTDIAHIISQALMFKHLHSSLLKRHVKLSGCWKLLMSQEQWGQDVSQCVFVFHFKLFHCLPPLILPLLMWTPAIHNPSLHPCSLSPLGSCSSDQVMLLFTHFLWESMSTFNQMAGN